LGLRLEDDWVWDFWIADSTDSYHVFYLHAPRSLVDPELRHVHATVGHAVSPDLRSWTVLDDALGPGAEGSWDDVAPWTGSVVRHEGEWYMFYTGATRTDGKIVQRVGAATSPDLATWSKLPGPLFQADRRWYEVLEDGDWFEEVWRDPWVFATDDGGFHALVTARAKDGPVDGRGVVGHAVSRDLLNWEVRPPLSRPGEFGHVEVIQTVTMNSEHLLVFSSDVARVSAKRRQRIGQEPGDVTYLVRAPGPLGPFDLTTARRALPPSLYSGRVVRQRDGSWTWLAFRNRDERGLFVGELSDPIPFDSPGLA
jgi:beta-fructofuranosidase